MHVLLGFDGNSVCLRQKLVERRYPRRQLHWRGKHVDFEQRQPNSLIARMASPNREAKLACCSAKRPGSAETSSSSFPMILGSWNGIGSLVTV
jgi:hypothetical protein